MNVKLGLLFLLGIVIAVFVFRVILFDSESGGNNQPNVPSIVAQFDTDLSKHSVSYDKLLSGGPGKDGIPALTNPEFVRLNESEEGDDVRGVLLELNGEKKFYPFSILVWHEIVNDEIGGEKVTVTFCPLCGSAIVFDPNVEGEDLEFGVSGLLYESNLVMYDRTTESLWTQAGRRAIVGDFTGSELETLPFKQITFSEVRQNHPSAMVLSRRTGHFRNYDGTPYSGYDESEELYFPVSVEDKRFHAKEIMYVIPIEDFTVAFPQLKLSNGERETFEVNGTVITAQKNNSEISVTDSDGKLLPGYFEMWFSWVVHNKENGVVWEMD